MDERASAMGTLAVMLGILLLVIAVGVAIFIVT